MLGSSLRPISRPISRLSRTALRQLTGPPSRRLDAWSVRAQLGARRNAMIASTVLAQRRAEHVEVEEFLAARLGRTGEDAFGRPAPTRTPFAGAAHG